jgi:hypothetical protein
MLTVQTLFSVLALTLMIVPARPSRESAQEKPIAERAGNGQDELLRSAMSLAPRQPLGRR